MQQVSESTRRYEHGLPLLAALDPGTLIAAWGLVKAGNPAGLMSIIGAMGKASEARTIRKLSAIWRASDVDLLRSETDKSIMAKHEEDSANRPFREAFEDAMDFFSGAAAQLGITLVSTAAGEGTKKMALPQDDSPFVS